MKEEDKIEKMIYDKNINLINEIDAINSMNEKIDYKNNKYARQIALAGLLGIFVIAGIIVFIIKKLFGI